MPPRYAYWTIIVDGQPTAFRSGALEDIMPTFNRLKEKQPTAELKWFQNGQLWASRHDAQDFMRARGDRGRERDPRQASASAEATADRPAAKSEGRPERAWNAKPEWKTRTTFSPASKPESGQKGRVASGFSRSDKPSFAKASAFAKATADKSEGKPAWTPKGDDGGKPEWKPKGTFKPKEAGYGGPSWTPKGDAGGKPAWKPKGTFNPKEAGHRPSARDQARSSFRPKSYTPKPDDGMTRHSRVQSRNDKLEWKPASAKGAARPDGPNAGFAKTDPAAPKRKWVPKAEYKKSLGIEAKRDDKWRPGGEHKDPKQKYKDAKKAKWTRVKATIRARSTKPRKPKDE